MDLAEVDSLFCGEEPVVQKSGHALPRGRRKGPAPTSFLQQKSFVQEAKSSGFLTINTNKQCNSTHGRVMREDGR